MVGVENEFDELVRSADLDMQSASRSMLHDCIDAVHICQHRRRDHLLRTTARKQIDPCCRSSRKNGRVRLSRRGRAADRQHGRRGTTWHAALVLERLQAKLTTLRVSTANGFSPFSACARPAPRLRLRPTASRVR